MSPQHLYKFFMLVFSDFSGNFNIRILILLFELVPLPKQSIVLPSLYPADIWLGKAIQVFCCF